jgi:hypothetical protein
MFIVYIVCRDYGEYKARLEADSSEYFSRSADLFSQSGEEESWYRWVRYHTYVNLILGVWP